MAVLLLALDSASAVLVALLVLVLVLLVILAARAGTRNYVRNSQYGATKAQFVYRATAGYLGLLVAFTFALALAPAARGWLVVGVAAILFIGMLILSTRIWLRFRHARGGSPPDNEPR